MISLIRVLVLDDEKLVRNQLRLLLSTTRDIHLVGEIISLQQLSSYCLEQQPHVILMGGGLKPFIFDIPALITQVSPATKIIALLDPHDTVRVQALLTTRLNGCLFRYEIDETLLHAIRAVAQGGTWFSRAVVRFMAHEPADQSLNQPQAAWPHHRLTRRDQQILACLLRNADNAQIGEELRLADQTVRNYVNQVCKKLGVSRDQLGKRTQTTA